MDFSVIICTYNRAQNLHKCIESLDRQQLEDDFKWEIVIIDNNSTDDTKVTVDNIIAQKDLSIRYAFEKEQGLNFARNRGIEESKGQYFAYIDDDILVTPKWLNAVYSSLKDNDADAVGGRIHLDQSIGFPSWLTPFLKGFLGYQDYGEDSFQMDGIRKYPYGGNMAFNRRVLDLIGLFTPGIGRKGEGKKRKELFKGSETDYLHRLSQAGGKIFYAPDAIVLHMVLPFQISKSYFRTIHFNAGYQKSFLDTTQHPHTVFGVPRFLIPQAVRALGNYVRDLVIKGPDGAFMREMTLGHFGGLIIGYLKRQ